jgi:acetyl esterase/lipase
MKLSTLCFLALLNLASAKPPSTPIPIPDDVRVVKDVSFLDSKRKERADLYYPKNLVPGTILPAVIVIHGGGFNDGDKARRRELSICSDLTRHGYAAMSINYKLWSKGIRNPTWPQSVHDAKTAVRWLRSNAESLGIDPTRIGALGGSAGGNLAAMLALTNPADGLDPASPLGEISAKVNCGVDLYGAVDLINYHDMKMFLKTREQDPAAYIKASPITYVGNSDSPLLIVHGTADDVVKLSQSITLAEKLKAAGSEYEFIIVEGGLHTFDLNPPQMDLKPAVIGFLDKHLKPQPLTQ